MLVQIVENVLAPTMDELKNHLREFHCFTLSTDASNHGSIKVFPVLIRYFLPYEGVQVRILEFPEQSSDIVVNYLSEVLSDLNKKIVEYYGGNRKCNFGRKKN